MNLKIQKAENCGWMIPFLTKYQILLMKKMMKTIPVIKKNNYTTCIVVELTFCNSSLSFIQISTATW